MILIDMGSWRFSGRCHLVPSGLTALSGETPRTGTFGEPHISSRTAAPNWFTPHWHISAGIGAVSAIIGVSPLTCRDSQASELNPIPARMSRPSPRSLNGDILVNGPGTRRVQRGVGLAGARRSTAIEDQ